MRTDPQPDNRGQPTVRARSQNAATRAPTRVPSCEETGPLSNFGLFSSGNLRKLCVVSAPPSDIKTHRIHVDSRLD